jgi:hypothetical protein
MRHLKLYNEGHDAKLWRQIDRSELERIAYREQPESFTVNELEVIHATTASQGWARMMMYREDKVRKRELGRGLLNFDYYDRKPFLIQEINLNDPINPANLTNNVFMTVLCLWSGQPRHRLTNMRLDIQKTTDDLFIVTHALNYHTYFVCDSIKGLVRLLTDEPWVQV